MMRRGERLFNIIQMLRSVKKPLTAKKIAQELGISARTVYRDIAGLMAQNIPIRGEAGSGYILEEGYDMPPLILTPGELEAAVLGIQWVIHRGDLSLTRAARELIGKISEIIPANLRPTILDNTMIIPARQPMAPDTIDMAQVREWIRSQRRIRIEYRDEKEQFTNRIIWPIAIAYFETMRLIITWCELRGGFRHFRSDRVVSVEFMEDTFPEPVEKLRQDWQLLEAENNQKLEG